MKSSADLEQTSDSTVEVNPSCGRLGNPRHDFEQRGLAAAVSPDDAEHLALSNIQTQVPQRPNRVALFAAVRVIGCSPEQGPRITQWRGHGIHRSFAKRTAYPSPPDSILLAQSANSDNRFHGRIAHASGRAAHGSNDVGKLALHLLEGIGSVDQQGDTEHC